MWQLIQMIPSKLRHSPLWQLSKISEGGADEVLGVEAVEVKAVEQEEVEVKARVSQEEEVIDGQI